MTMFTILSVCKGGGYRYCRTDPPHPKRNAKGLYPLHRVLVENKIGRLLSDNEEVHHIDENKENDDPDNLEEKTKAAHAKHHLDARAPKPIKLLCECGREFELKPCLERLRRLRNKTGKVYCSRSCGSIYPSRL